MTSSLLASAHGLSNGAIILILLAGFGAGLFNGVAGGGTMLSFPTLLALGVPPLTANISSTVGILPGYAASIVGFRREIANQRGHLRRLVLPGICGSILGALLLLTTSASVFRYLVIVLVGLATLLFAVQPLVAKAISARTTKIEHRTALVVGITVTALYGGYFGAGMGIMLLVVFGLTLPVSLSESSGLRSVLSIMVNAIAATIFLLHGAPNWAVVAALAPSSLVGGYLGAHLSRKLPVPWLRACVVGVGILTTVVLIVRA